MFVLAATIPLYYSLTLQAGVKDLYTKTEYKIVMRDGVKLHTVAYVPKATAEKYPIIMVRTPYSCRPYGEDAYPGSVGPFKEFQDEGYVFVTQDVRGRYMSEGDFKWMNPFIPVKTRVMVDESTDCYDTIEWLTKNIPNNNGRVGIWGISFPGHYAAQSLIDSHPALKAVSPQAPMADNWLGDDMHHNGALFLPHSMNFISGFGKARTGPTQNYGGGVFTHGTPDGYKFFLEMGPLKNAATKYNMSQIKIWNEWMLHGDYDEYWQKQNVTQHMKKITPAVLWVGGWFDAEDLQGPLSLYGKIERDVAGADSRIIMGPWYHGSWNRGPGDALHDIKFDVKTGEEYRPKFFAFFNYYLKGKGTMSLPDATMFDSGAHRWQEFPAWPPKQATLATIYFYPKGKLTVDVPFATPKPISDEYTSDPAKPVPCSAQISTGMPRQYMLEDQRFVANRPDVLVYQTQPLTNDMTLAGPVIANLLVSTSGTDSDFIVKLIDVFPDDFMGTSAAGTSYPMRGYQMMVRGEPMRAKYRNSWSKPQALVPNLPTTVKFAMPDVFHTFRKGHRLMVQIQSSWFPLIDRNPQKFCNIYTANESDFQRATQRVFMGGSSGTSLKVSVLR